MNDPGLIPDIQSPKKTVKSKKEELVKEIVSKYDMAEEMSKEAARLSLEAANKTQESLKTSKRSNVNEFGIWVKGSKPGGIRRI